MISNSGDKSRWLKHVKSKESGAVVKAASGLVSYAVLTEAQIELLKSKGYISGARGNWTLVFKG